MPHETMDFLFLLAIVVVCSIPAWFTLKWVFGPLDRGEEPQVPHSILASRFSLPFRGNPTRLCRTCIVVARDYRKHMIQILDRIHYRPSVWRIGVWWMGVRVLSRRHPRHVRESDCASRRNSVGFCRVVSNPGYRIRDSHSIRRYEKAFFPQ